MNPIVRCAVRHDLSPGSYALLETARRWIVPEHGARAGYIHNIRANPRVRIKLRDDWRDGTARVLDDDDPRARLRRMGLRLNALVVRLMGTELLTVRIDLDPDGAGS